jgi:hypothetical protein
MKKSYWLLSILVAASLLVAFFLMNNPNVGAYLQTVAQTGDDETPRLEIGVDSEFTPLSPGNFPGTHPVYFSPSDHNATATVIILYNTTSVTKTAYVQAFNNAGSLTVNVEVPLTPYERKYLISDSLAASPPPSWQNNLLTDFGDFSTVGVIYVPDGVFFDGYVVFNGATNTIDPRADQGALPLHFSTDPATVFLPAITTTP